MDKGFTLVRGPLTYRVTVKVKELKSSLLLPYLSLSLEQLCVF